MSGMLVWIINFIGAREEEMYYLELDRERLLRGGKLELHVIAIP